VGGGGLKLKNLLGGGEGGCNARCVVEGMEHENGSCGGGGGGGSS